MLQPERGQVKVATYANSGLLTVHVIQARNLQSKWQENCNAYIKVTLHPEDNDDPAKCKTAVQSQSNCPSFDEKFSFELLEEDVKKRILVSAWHHEQDTGHNEFLGCMSFGIQHIVSHRRIVNGWYYLLTEKLGKRKHLQVGTRNVADPSSVPKINQELALMEPYVFVLKKELDQDHGIEVGGAFPAIVTSLMKGSCGESVGLKPGDRISRINGFNVSRSTDESVARILRSSENQIILEVQRPRSSGSRSKPTRSRSINHPRPRSQDDSYMDQQSQAPSQFSSQLNLNEEQKIMERAEMYNSQLNLTQQDIMEFAAFKKMLAFKQAQQDIMRESMLEANPGAQMYDNGSGEAGYNMIMQDSAGNHFSNMYEALPGGGGLGEPSVNQLAQHERALSQMSIDVDEVGGEIIDNGELQCDESECMSQVMHSKRLMGGVHHHHHEHSNAGYTSEGKAMSLRRTSTRAPSRFRGDTAGDGGYYSEGQAMRRPKSFHQAQVHQPHPAPGHSNEAYFPSQQLQHQQMMMAMRGGGGSKHSLMHESQLMDSVSHVRRGGGDGYSSEGHRGISRRSRGNGYSSEGQPMSIASHRQRNRMPLPTVEENGYYSEGGPGMRMRHNMSRQGGAGGSVSGGGSVYNVGHHQVMTREKLEQMYGGGGQSIIYEEQEPPMDPHQHPHNQACPMHLSTGNIDGAGSGGGGSGHGSGAEEHLSGGSCPPRVKRDKVAMWLDNIPHPEDMHHTADNPIPDGTIIDEKPNLNSKSKDKEYNGNKLNGLGLDPIYEEPECSVSMLTHLKHQLKPIQEEGEWNKENKKPGKKSGGTGGVKLFTLCGGIGGGKKSKKKGISC